MIQLDKATPVRRATRRGAAFLLVLLAFTMGMTNGYLLWGGNATVDNHRAHHVSEAQLAAMTRYPLEMTLGDLGPRLIEAGAIDYEAFNTTYQQAGRPLTDWQQALLNGEAVGVLEINPENAYFLLNFFWALGLTNDNPVLRSGPMMQYGAAEVGSFASTGGWTLGRRPATALYASLPLVTLTDVQQARLEEVAQGVYRPCCANATDFPDCNHGMAMLGLLEVMAAQDASVEEMFRAAKYANAVWFPAQSAELATFFQAQLGQDFAAIDARELVSERYSSGVGFAAVHETLGAAGYLDRTPASGASCGV